MKRRSFLKIFAGLAAGALPAASAGASPRRIAVAGGGIIGASIAYHLAQRGAEVTLFEKHRPGSGTTGKSFAWINTHFSKQPRHYHRLNRLSTLAYRHLDNELGGKLGVQWGGALEWYGDPERAGRLRSQAKKHQEWGYPVRLVDESEFSRLEPHIVPGPVQVAAYSELEGSVDSVRATEVLLEGAANAGAEVVHPCEVTALDLRWGRLRGVETTKGKYETDALVIACGVDTPGLATMAGLSVPLVHSPGILAHTQPLPRQLHGVVVAPGPHMKQKRDGGLVIGEAIGPPIDEIHEHLFSGPHQGFPDKAMEEIHGERLVEQAKRFFPSAEQAAVDRVTLGWRPLPKDGYPVIGFPDCCPDIYLAVTHSGVTLAPIVGRLAALEILDGVRVDLLSSYRVSRFDKVSPI